MPGLVPRRGVLACVATFAASRVRAQDGRGAPIRIVVPFAPGGSTDLVARLVAAGMGERLGQPVLIDNRPGSGGMVGAAAVAAAAPDGLTLLLSNIASNAISPALYGHAPYDPVAGFTHLALIVTNPSVLVANPAFPATALADVVRLARARPGGLDVASSGVGSSNHLLIVQLADAAGITLNHVPYRGAGPAMTDLIAGVVPLMADSLPSASGHVRAGAARALAVSDTVRSPQFPAVPTFREAGLDLVSLSWFGLSGPPGMADAVTARLAGAARATLADGSVRIRLAELGGTPGELDRDGYAAFVRAEAARWPAVVAAAGARVE